jgi:glycosyltransferase involved in cell wall biosynthesis
MSKIALFDSNCQKFTKDMTDWWTKQGHEVEYQPGYNPELVRWADVVWFDTADNNAVRANHTDSPADQIKNMDLTGKKIICRPIDIEVWCGVDKGIDWTGFTDIVYPSKHIKEMMLVPDFVKAHDIPHGVDTDKFTFRNKPRGKKIAWVTRRWSAKGKEFALEIAYLLKRIDPEYKIYALGVDDYGSWEKAYFEYFIKTNNLDNIIWEDHTDDMNTWLEDKDFALCCSKKETFSFAIAEGMAKGLKPLIHNFLGAEDIWDKKYIWNTTNDCVKMILEDDFNPQEYKEYIDNHYTFKKMMERIDHEVLNNNPQSV